MASAEKIIIRPILPKDPQFFAKFGEEMVRQVSATMNGPVAKTLTKASESFIDNWEHAPKIDTTFTQQKTQLKLWVGPKGTNKRYWVFVSLGTTGKVYGPKSAQFLNVRGGYSPKTKVGGGKGTGTYKGPFRQAAVVHWPGVKPRHFEEQIVKKYGKAIVLQIGSTIEKILRKYK